MIDQAFADEIWADASESFRPIGNREPGWHELIAHHEAGHLVAGYVADAVLAGGTVQPHGHWGGAALFFLGSDGRSPTLDGIIAKLAGSAAARRFAARSRDDGGDHDRQRVEADLVALARTGEVRDLIRRHCEAQAVQIVNENWDFVEAVAKALLDHDTLNGAQLRAVFAKVEADRAVAREPERRRAWSAAVVNAATFPPAVEDIDVLAS